METRNFQERLVQLGRDFDNLIHVVQLPKGDKKQIEITYRGKEKLDGVFTESADISIREIVEVGGEIKIRVIVRCSMVGTQNKALTVYFDPESPFYTKDEDNIVRPNTKKLKQQINFQLKGANEFEKDTYDFGSVEEGDPIVFEFTYIGNRQISGVKGNCGCTNVKIDGNKISGILDTDKMRGSVGKSINVYFGDYERQFDSFHGILIPSKDSSLTQLTIKGNVLPKNK